MIINLNRKYSRPKGNGRKILVRLLVFLIFLGLVLGVPINMAYSGVKEAQLHGKALASAYQNQNFGQIQVETSSIKNAALKIDSSINFLFWLRFIPIIGGYYSDVKGITSGGLEELKAVEVILADLKPKEEKLGFLGKPIPSQDRVSQLINVLDQTIPLLDKVEENLKKAKEDVKDVNGEKWPENLLGFPARSTISVLRNFITGVYLAATDNIDVLALAPSTLGQAQPKTYLLLFQNDKEIRPTGGFITAYAFLKVDKGQITTTVSDDIYRLDERLLGTCESKVCPLKPPSPIVRYLPEVSGQPRQAWSMRDSNLSPDLPSSAKEFERMYEYLGQGLPFDGIIYIDSQVVEELIDVTGEIDVFGTPYSSKVDHRCNCPNVIYELENYAEIAAKGTQDRKAILGVLMSQILAKLVGTETEKIPQAIETIVRLANHKHIMFYMHDQKTQSALAKLNWIGEIQDFDGDFLHINDSNFAGGKSNLYVEQTVTQEIKFDKGKVTKKINIEYKNPQPFGVWLNGINRDYVRFYVPIGSKLISGRGSEDGVRQIGDELGKSVFEAFITVRPQNSRKLEIEYEILYSPKDEYKLKIQKQPGAKDFQYKVKLNGSQRKDFKLDRDREFKFDI